MKYFAALCLLLACFFFGCQSDSSDPESEPISGVDSTERIDTVFSQEEISHLDELKFAKFEGTQKRPVNWSEFRMITGSQDDSLVVSTFQPENSFYTMYGHLLRYSPDSSMFIDIDSYNIEMHKNKAGQSVALEKGTDTEVSLVNLGTKEKTRLVFLGPGNGIEDAGWIDNNNVLLLGYHETDTLKTKKAMIWTYHIPTKTFHLYESPDTTVARRLINWRQERLGL